uniref:Uncharacterized protein n=1 Tax=Caenorhabditis japonica TaxID=281687 RepID=A0A8R1EIY7_CAEJA
VFNMNRLALPASRSVVKTFQRKSSGSFYGSNNVDGFKESFTTPMKQAQSEFY